MAEPGDLPKSAGAWPDDSSAHDHDDLIGFTSPGSLAGTARTPEPPKVEPPVAASWTAATPRYRDDPTDDLFDDDADPIDAPAASESPVAEADASPEAAVQTDPADDLGPLFTPGTAMPAAAPIAAAPIAAVAASPRPANADFDAPPAPRPAAAPVADPSVLPAWARETPRQPKPGSAAFGRAQRAAPPEGAMSLYAVYALILFAVPTFGLAAMIALVSVISRPVPAQDLAASHFIFQKRTLWIAAFGAAIGVVLIAVNLGVFVLVGMALWVIVRGAAGLIRLAAGRPVKNPLTWTI